MTLSFGEFAFRRIAAHNQDMNQDRTTSSSARVYVAATTFLIFILPILYLLSFGPVVGLQMRGYLPEGPVRAIYHPIVVLHDRAGPPISTMLERYLKIFEP